MWWNFIGRTHEEVETYRRAWEDRLPRGCAPTATSAAPRASRSPPATPATPCTPRPCRGSAW